MSRFLRIRPFLLLGLLTFVLMATAPTFLPGYDEGPLGLAVFAIGYVLIQPAALLAGLLRLTPLAGGAATVLAHMGALAFYASLDVVAARLFRARSAKDARM